MILVFDLTSKVSFEALPAFLREWQDHMPSEELAACLTVICGNKSDAADRTVSEGRARLWAETAGFHYYETSASSGSD